MHTRYFTILLLAACSNLATIAQPKLHTTANAHSHNDYRQQQPFSTAYNERFGSIEADIHLVDGRLKVAHDTAELITAPLFESLYLQPLSNNIELNKGFVYPDKGRQLLLLIDIKSDPIPTLQAITELLKKYPAITACKSLQLVITGNKPAKSRYTAYPGFIWFDGSPDSSYSKKELKKIALLSNDFKQYSSWKKGSAPDKSSFDSIATIVRKAHLMQKPIRFWNSPDMPFAWKALIDLEVDYINTDHITALSDFLSRRYDSLRLMPYNRIIRSAGDVIRYGNPDLENHALDIAILSNNKALVVQDRYGIMALDVVNKKILSRWSFTDLPRYSKYMSTYSGIQSLSEEGKTWVVWSAAEKDSGKGAIMMAAWDNGFTGVSDITIPAIKPAANALPNEIIVNREKEGLFLYVVLNGNNELLKIRWADRSIVWRSPTGVAPYGLALANGNVYVSNWAGAVASDSTRERAGVPWGLAYTDPRTGATASGTVSIFNPATGQPLSEITVGLHPNVVKASNDGRFVYVANGSSDHISVINTSTNTVAASIEVGLLTGKQSLQGSTPNGLELNTDNSVLYVSNGFDNAVAVVSLGKDASLKGKGASKVIGYIPTEAYPAGLKIFNNYLVVANLEAEGANVINASKKARAIHHQLASVSCIPLPGKKMLETYTLEVAQLNMMNRSEQLQLLPREHMAPVPVPERIGEPSVFKHVVYIIKENKTYDQVFGDIPLGRGDSSLCIFGEKITPNTHALAKQFGWMDNYYASGKSSAEGHQWTDGGMVSDYVEKNVRAWFRSYPHRQEDALVYNKSGFIWNHALDHGKTVRVYGEACTTEYDRRLKWADHYLNYKAGKVPEWYNTSTIARLRPIIHPTFPDCDNIAFSDQHRADIFIEDWKKYEQGDSLPNLMIVSLPNDHSAGTSPNFPTPNAMVADNDLAVGRIIDMISKSRYWDSTVVFITQDDSQSGWDHISAYRTVGLMVSPYSTGQLITSDYNQTSMLRTIEQILGLPPMNILDASARLMTDCFQPVKKMTAFNFLPTNIPLDQMNKPLQALKGKERKFALQSEQEVFNEVDGGEDDTMNRIIWFYAKGNAPYPGSK